MYNKFKGYDEDRYDLEHTERKEAIRRGVSRALFWLISVPVVILLAYFICHIGIEKTRVINSSMEPTLSKNDNIIINKFSYMLSSPERFDVIVIDTGDNEHSVYDIKRVYGLPGETIQILNGQILINGKAIEDVVNVKKMELSGIAVTPIKLGENEYFVLADERENSEDSRYLNYGLVKGSNIVGKAFIRTNNFSFVNMLNKLER